MMEGSPDHTAHFWDALARGEFELQVCDECAATYFPPRIVCPSCGSITFKWRTLAGTGAVYAAVTVHRAPMEFEAPYHLALVDLDEGIRVLTHVRASAAPSPGERVVMCSGRQAGDVPFAFEVCP